MINCTQVEVDELLYNLSEEFEDEYCISGIWTSGIFRNFWYDIVQRSAEDFLQCITIKPDGSYCLQLFSKGKYLFIYQDEEIKQRYFQFIRKRILRTPVNASIMELIKTK